MKRNYSYLTRYYGSHENETCYRPYGASLYQKKRFSLFEDTFANILYNYYVQTQRDVYYDWDYHASTIGKVIPVGYSSWTGVCERRGKLLLNLLFPRRIFSGRIVKRKVNNFTASGIAKKSRNVSQSVHC